MIRDDEFLKKYNKVCNKVSNRIKKGLDNKSAYKEKYLKTKIKPYGGKVKTNLHDDGIPKEGPHCICL